jgi:hypothetical protein
MRNLEALSQFIVPLVFLAIWALTSILNQEGRSLPKRPGAAPGPAQRPRPRPQRSDEVAAVRAEEAAASRAASGGPADPSAPRRIGTARPPGRDTDAEVYVIDDEMVFVDPTTHRRIGSASIPTASRPPGGTPKRKPPRARRPEQDAVKPRRGDQDTHRSLSEQVGLSMAQNRGDTMAALTRLAPSGLTNLGATSLGATSLSAASVAATVTQVDGRPSLSAAEVRQLIAEPGRLREMAVLIELLQPAVSRRGPRRRV